VEEEETDDASEARRAVEGRELWCLRLALAPKKEEMI
jgi:hypothetical protein